MTKDQALGAVVGCAIGDALGTTLEFSRDPNSEPSTWHREITGGGPFNLPEGGWTDDTSMMLALMDTYLERGFLDAPHCAENFLKWFKDGEFSHRGECFDIGIATSTALENYSQSSNPISGSVDPMSSGNGGIMRLAPSVVANHSDQHAARRDAVVQSAITHASEECLLIAGEMADVIWTGSLDTVEHRLENLNRLSWSELLSGGYIRETWDCALWCVSHSDSFEEALIKTVNRRFDADTTGAVAGQIAGAIYGLSGIPERWLEKLIWRESVIEQASQLYEQGKSPYQRTSFDYFDERPEGLYEDQGRKLWYGGTENGGGGSWTVALSQGQRLAFNIPSSVVFRYGDKFDGFSKPTGMTLGVLIDIKEDGALLIFNPEVGLARWIESTELGRLMPA